MLLKDLKFVYCKCLSLSLWNLETDKYVRLHQLLLFLLMGYMLFVNPTLPKPTLVIDGME